MVGTEAGKEVRGVRGRVSPATYLLEFVRWRSTCVRGHSLVTLFEFYVHCCTTNELFPLIPL